MIRSQSAAGVLAANPEALKAIAPLSNDDGSAITAEVAGKVAKDINTWFYSAGGLFADKLTRGALLGLRIRCRTWANDPGAMPKDLYTFRDLSVLLLRRDLDLDGLESFDFEDDIGLLARIQTELAKYGLSVRAIAKS